MPPLQTKKEITRAISLATQNVEEDFIPHVGSTLQRRDAVALQRRDAFAVQRGLDAQVQRAKLRNQRLEADIDLSKKLARWSMWAVGLLLLFYVCWFDSLYTFRVFVFKGETGYSSAYYLDNFKRCRGYLGLCLL